MFDGFRAPETLEGTHSAMLESDGMHPRWKAAESDGKLLWTWETWNCAV